MRTEQLTPVTVSVQFDPTNKASCRKALKQVQLTIAELRAKATKTKVDDVVVTILKGVASNASDGGTYGNIQVIG